MEFERLKDFLTPKTFNKISYVAVICWMLYGATLLSIFAAMENSDSFRCEAQNMNLVQGKCLDQYKKQYNTYGIPVYGFVIANFSIIGIVCVIYSQVVTRVPDEVEANRQAIADVETPLIQNNDYNKPKHRLFVAYFCQLATRLAIAIIFIVLQTQVLYPGSFPSDFHCQIAAASHAASASSTSNIPNSTMYECYNQQATKITSWMNAVIVGNVVLALVILIEITCILALRVKQGRKFLEDYQFYPGFILGQPSLDEYINSLKKSIRDGTEELSQLRALFKVQPGEGKRNRDLKLDHIYTNLLLIPNKAKHDFTGNRKAQLNVYPQSTKTAKLISREEIIDSENKKIFVVGRPGIGKTLFLTKWLREWASGKALNNFDLLFLVKFRKFNSEENPLSLRDLLSRSEYSERLSNQVWSHVRENPEKVLIFFDGFDESSYRSRIANESFCDRVEEPMLFSALFYNIVKGNLLPGATVLTTTRPSAMDDVAGLPFDKTIEILGFSSEQVETYVENFVKDAAEGVQDAGKKIWEHIKTNMSIFSLCYIPVNCFIICSCLLQVLKFHSEKALAGVGLPTKLTDIYQRCVKLFFLLHDKHLQEDLTQEDIHSKHFPPEVERKIQPLAKLAFDGLTQKRLIFGQNEVPGDLENLVLLHRLPDSKPDPFTNEPQYCFIHLTMQEFLAAKHITETMKKKELKTFIANHIKNGEWQLVLQFVAGLCEQSINIFTDLLPQTTEKKDGSELMYDNSLEGLEDFTCWPASGEKDLALTLLKCIQETTESGSIDQSKFKEIGSVNAVDFSSCRLAPADCTAVVHFIKHVQQISLINLSDNNIGSLVCVEIVKLFGSANCQLRYLNLRYNSIDDEGVKQLSNALEKSQLSSLHLGRNNITDEGVTQLSNVLANSQLSSLNLEFNDITDEGVKQLSNGIVNSQLSSLDLGQNNITDEGVKQLSNVLKNSHLSSLNLLGNFRITYKTKTQTRDANPKCRFVFNID